MDETECLKLNVGLEGLVGYHWFESRRPHERALPSWLRRPIPINMFDSLILY